MNIEQLINHIKPAVGMYIGEVSLSNLEHFIQGFMFNNTINYRREAIDEFFEIEFQKRVDEWIIKNYGQNALKDMEERGIAGWSYRIMDVVNDENEALDIFFQLVEEYFKEFHSSELKVDDSRNIGKQIDIFKELKKKEIYRFRYQEIRDRIENKIFKKYTKERNVIVYPMFDSLIDDYLSIDIPDSWKFIKEFIQHEDAIMFFNKHEEKYWYEFKDGSDIVELYNSLPLVDFYVTNWQGNYLLAYNHSQGLIAVGAASEWLRKRNNKQYTERDAIETYWEINEGFEAWNEYDENGRLIHQKTSEDVDCRYEYDEKGNEIHRKDVNGDEFWREYDENGKEIHCKYANGDESWREYDENGNEIHYRDSDGYERWYEYNENGKEIYCRDSSGYETATEYDENGKEIHCKTIHYKSDFAPREQEEWHEYDENGNEIHYKKSPGYEYWNEYDENGNEIHHRVSGGYETATEYDENGNKIYCKSVSGSREREWEEWFEYDENGNEIHSRKSDGYERWCEYNKCGRLIHTKESDSDESWLESRYEYDERGHCTHYVKWRSWKNKS